MTIIAKLRYCGGKIRNNISIQTEAKDMALDLLKRINNITLSLSRYTSFIDVEEDPDNPTYNPFL
jgi:hypothetical protein